MQTLFDILRAQFDNQFVSGGLLLGLIAAVLASLRHLPLLLWGQLKRLVLMTVVIDSRNDLFNAALAWLDSAPAGRKSRLVSVVVSTNDETTANLAQEAGALTVRALPRLLYSPAPGLHLFWHRRRLMWIERDIQMNLHVVETLRITSLFGRRAEIEELLKEMLEVAYGALAHQTVLWTVDRWAENWVRSDAKRRRPLTSVILAHGVQEDLTNDVNQFFAARERYAELGIPWRRGYLFYGPPGTGKTSLAFAMAGHWGLDLCILSLTNSKLTDQNIAELLQKTPARSIILLEDVDAFFLARDKLDAKVEVSFSGLLNALDGVAAQEGRIVILTTNHQGNLDPALVRPGRIDKQLQLSQADAQQVAQMFLRFYPQEQALAEAIMRDYAAKGLSLSPAQVQQRLMAAGTAEQSVVLLLS